MKRGEVYWIELSPSRGGELQKMRPAVIVSNDLANHALNRVQVVPLSSQISKVYPCEALVTVNRKQSKAMADQITTISKERVRNKLGKLSAQHLEAVERAICIQLDL